MVPPVVRTARLALRQPPGGCRCEGFPLFFLSLISWQTAQTARWLSLILLLHFWPVPSLLAAPKSIEGPYASDRIVVKFREDRCAHLLAAAGTNLLAELKARLPLPNDGALEEPPLRRALRRQRHPARADQPELDRFLYLKLPAGMNVSNCLELLREHPLLEYAEPDGIGQGGIIPNDSDFSRQWHHRNVGKPGADIGTPAAWDITTGSNSIIVAVLDSGLRTNLQEFAGRSVPGYDFANNDADPFDDHGHGTAVAGTLMANGNNGMVVAGADWNCKVMPVKVLDANNSGSYSWWADAVDFAANHGAKVINLSAGGSGSSTPLTSAINNAIAAGVIFVTITHNDGSGVVRYPGNLPQCITVGATDERDLVTGFSNYGPQIDLVAPGTNIWTVSTGGARTVWWGTSFAAPLVSGVCALLLSRQPDLKQEDALRLLTLGAEDGVGDANDTPGFDNRYGWGRLNAYHSLLLAKTSIDRIASTNTHGVVLSWPSPPNASDKQPFNVEFATSSIGPWTKVSYPADFQYTASRTTWIDPDGSFSGMGQTKFFRLRLRSL